ncbi:hypothetical protein H6F56_25385 [Microcoleus sp. FACHB-672]|nr:hypothetical protein [Microcoleus sp. FACHB-672]
MMTKKINTKSTKDEILKAFEELSQEKIAIKSELEKLQKEQKAATSQKPINQPQGEPNKMMNQGQVAQQKMNQTIESLAKIQLNLGSAVSELSEQLTLEASQLAEIRQSVAAELKQLEELHALQVAEDTLETLIQEYEESSKEFYEELSQRREALEQEKQEQKKAWDKEQEEYKRATKERNDLYSTTRQRDTQEYQYELKLQRQLNTDEYELQQKSLYTELEEIKKVKEKEWAERAKQISEREKQYEEAKAKVDAFAKDKEAAIKKATEEGKGIGNYQAKVSADLYAKEVEGQKRLYELRMQSLEQTIQTQDARILSLSKQLESALKQVQDLAVKAIEGASNMSSSQVLKEIALEQAKTLQKSK